MSDPFTDAHRPYWKPKGFGWWSKEEQREHLQKYFDQGLRDQDFIFEMVNRKLLTPSEARTILFDGPDTGFDYGLKVRVD